MDGKTGSEVFDELIKFIRLLERQTGARVRTIRCDDHTELVNGFTRRRLYCEREGIALQHTAGYAPEHNAVGEQGVAIIKRHGAAMVASTSPGPASWGTPSSMPA